MPNIVPEKIINGKVYKDGYDQLGIADVKLPSLDSISEKIKGFGIAGEVDSPTLGHFGSMTVQFNFRVVTGDLITLCEQKAHELDIRAAKQEYDAGSGEYSVGALRVSLRATPKKTDLGKLDQGKPSDSSLDMEVIYMNIMIDGDSVLELDKYNFIYKVNGVDQLEDVRSALGM